MPPISLLQVVMTVTLPGRGNLYPKNRRLIRSRFEPIASKILSPVNKVVDSGVDKLSNTALIKGAAGNQVSGPGGTSSYQQTNTSGLERGLAAAENAGVISGAIGTFRGVSPTKAVRAGAVAIRLCRLNASDCDFCIRFNTIVF